MKQTLWRTNTLCVATAALVLALTLSSAAFAQEETSVQESAPPPVPSVNPLKTRDELQAAYQKEYAFLEAQIRDLNARLADFEAASNEAERNKEAQIDRTEGELIGLQSRSDRVDSLLTEADRQFTAVEDGRSLLEATFVQADATLEQYEIAAVNGDAFLMAADGERIQILLSETLDLLVGLGSVKRAEGAFFLKDGTEVSGTIIRVGNIAAYGISNGQGGALAPAGDGRMKVWAASTPETAQALVSGDAPDVLDIFLFESSQKAIEESAGKTLIGVINSGGSIAWIIVALGGLAALLILLRIFFLQNASSSTGKVVSEVGSLVKQGQLEQALQACKRLKGSTSRVVAAAVRNLDKDRTHVEDIVSEQILHESSHLNRFGAFIIVIAAVAPLLGLLGTVTGMISTFDIITEFGTGDPKLLSSGISIALVTTEVGLAVAIPALIFGNLLTGWSDSIKDDMEKAALHVMNLYLDRPANSSAA
ncbi:MAG TPA: MotA/TolQ/ExbB proton channel family protein [Xanthomonadales bacterium]|nr:MotA/TolQ/ExbB proton channel family protein [Xanthomonadales bacterium]